jgi:L-glutamine-phosphate cytidylyltransferase
MKAIILAAGSGERLRPYTVDTPKCLLPFAGEPLLRRQIRTLRSCGIDELFLVKGYLAEAIDEPGIRSFVNSNYGRSNMVESLFCAESALKDDVLICYGDLLFEQRILESLLNAPKRDVYVLADEDWGPYYEMRFGSQYAEAESFVVDGEKRIVDIGRANPSETAVMARYIGILLLSSAGCIAFHQLFNRAKTEPEEQLLFRGRSLARAYMTDFLQALIDQGFPIHAHLVRRGWLEFDSTDDYQRALHWHQEGLLGAFLRL